MVGNKIMCSWCGEDVELAESCGNITCGNCGVIDSAENGRGGEQVHYRAIRAV